MNTSEEFNEWLRRFHKEPNVQVQFKNLFLRTKATIEKESQLSLETILLIARLEQDNAAVNLGFFMKSALAEALGLTGAVYWKRAQVGRVVSYFPETLDMLKNEDLRMSHLALIAPKITHHNKDRLLDTVKGKTTLQIREILSHFP